MKRVLATWIALLPASTAWAWPSFLAETPQIPHPAVVRVIAAETDGASLGSGSLVAVDANHGLVVTNWHVVRDATGPITVVFSNGFRSGAIVLRTDRDWDLAALAIQRPNVQPLLISTEPPRPGDVLTIAGYGSGAYRALSGRCSEYLSPGANFPAELVEVDVPARLGDSGGPILNSKGEVAGVLFGAAGSQLLGGYTMGSYCGRVRYFLAATYGDFRRLSGTQRMLAEAPAPVASPPTTAISMTPMPLLTGGQVTPQPLPQPQPLRPVVAVPPVAAPPLAEPLVPVVGLSPSPTVPLRQSAAPSPPPARPAPVLKPQTVGPVARPLSATDTMKTVLAAIGIIAVCFHGLRLIGAVLG